MLTAFVTSAASFIRSNLVDRLLADGVRVTGWDNFSTGQERFLEGVMKHPAFLLVRGDSLDLPALRAGKMLGFDLTALSLDTVKMFAKDAADAGFTL